jgi:hypothetical protein
MPVSYAPCAPPVSSPASAAIQVPPLAPSVVCHVTTGWPAVAGHDIRLMKRTNLFRPKLPPPRLTRKQNQPTPCPHTQTARMPHPLEQCRRFPHFQYIPTKAFRPKLAPTGMARASAHPPKSQPEKHEQREEQNQSETEVGIREKKHQYDQNGSDHLIGSAVHDSCNLDPHSHHKKSHTTPVPRAG